MCSPAVPTSLAAMPQRFPVCLCPCASQSDADVLRQSMHATASPTLLVDAPGAANTHIKEVN